MIGLLRKSGRTMRAVLAVVATMALAALFITHQDETAQAKERAMSAVSGTSWKVSELVFEAQRLSMALRLHASGEVKRSDVELQFDLLWSRVDVMESTDVAHAESLTGILGQYRTFLTSNEATIFESPIIPPRLSIQMARELASLARELRVAWVATFEGNLFAGLAARSVDDARARRVRTLILGLMGFLAVYVIAEIAFAGVAQRREEELRREAAQANEAKSRFLANVSHEIRTPLNGILGMTSELAETTLDEDQTGCLKVIRQSGDLLLNTLNDVLDLSKVEAGAIDIERVPFDLVDTVQTAHALYLASARSKGIRFEFQVAPDVTRWVTGDETRIRQVLHNLISNALKFTSKGRVQVTVRRAEKTDAVRFIVADTGPGIAPNVQHRVFKPFSQADASVTRKHGGTGLGLSISRQLVNAMGGEIHLESEAGQGATFWFDLSLHPAQDRDQTTYVATQISENPHEVAGLRILIVDDNATNRLILRRFLKATGAQLEEVADGKSAVHAIKTKAFDIVLMDVQMPVMDGVEATRQIRDYQSENNLPECHVIAVTANVMEDQIREYLAKGMNDVLGKPVSKHDLLKKIGDLATDKGATAQVA